jgi:uridylate kinase
VSKKRVLIKVSGEYLKGEGASILDHSKLISLAKQICELSSSFELGIVVGGGNI